MTALDPRIFPDAVGPMAMQGQGARSLSRAHPDESLVTIRTMDALEAFACGIAHDYNNVLSVILGFAELLDAELEDGDSRRVYVAEIVRAGQGAAMLTNRLMACGGRLPHTPIDFSVNDLVVRLEPRLRQLIGDQVTLTTRLDPDPGRIKADPRLIEQIVEDLALNARDALPSGGRITIQTANVDVRPALADLPAGEGPRLVPYVALAIRDSGRGLSEAERARIFEPFFTGKGKGRATGLSLASIRGMVRQSGGCIEVTSAPDMGTTFTVYLPRLATTSGSQLATIGRSFALASPSWPGVSDTVMPGEHPRASTGAP